MYDTINLGRRIDVVWPNPTMRSKGGKSFWKNWLPEAGMEGLVGILIVDSLISRVNYVFQDRT